ncbi:MAG: MFS transporter [Desulfobacterales bacterium]|nr:MFS transporter [Desulfobacterales bacterium]
MTDDKTNLNVLKPFLSLYAAVFFLLTAIGLLSTYLSLRLSIAGVSVQATGLVMTVYFLGLTVGTFYCGSMIRLVGHIRAFTAFAAVSTAAVLIHGMYLSVPLWCVLRFITGMANIGIFMVLESWLNECAEPKARGRVFALYMVMTYLGVTIGQKVLTLADVESQTLYLVAGAFMVLSIVPIATTRGIHPKLPRREGIRFITIFKKAPIGMTGSFAAGLLLSAFYAMAPVFAHQIKMDVSQLSWFMTLTVLGGLFFQWPVGAISDRFDRSLVLPFVGIAFTSVAVYICLAARESVNLLLSVTVVFGGMLFTIYPVSVARAHDMFEPKDVVRVSSALLLVYGVGAVIGPMLASTVMRVSGTPYGLYYYFTGGAILFVVFSLVWRNLESVEIVPAEEQVDFVIMKTTSNVAMHLDPRQDVPVEETIQNSDSPEDPENQAIKSTGGTSGKSEPA